MKLESFDRWCLRLGRGAVLLGLVLLPIVLAEGAARLLYDPPPVRRVWDPYAYRILLPAMADTFENAEGERVTVRTNALGMRGPDVAETPPPGALTLVFLGGSTTENYAFAREDTFPEQIGERLGAELGRPVRVWNAGSSAATTSSSLARLQHQALDLSPSLIVVKHAVNDLVSGFHPRFRGDGRHLVRPPAAGRRPRSYFVDWLRKRRSRWRSTQPLATGERQGVESYDGFPALGVFERNLRSMAAIADTHRVPILFLTMASRYRTDPDPGDEARFRVAASVTEVGGTQPDVPSLARGMDAFNAAVLTLPAGPFVHVFDLAARLPRTEDVLFDECHLTRAGNRLVAEEVAPVAADILRKTPPQR